MSARKCWWHDWVVVDTDRVAKLAREMKAYKFSRGDDTYVHKRVCLVCEKVDDQIETERLRLRDCLANEERRLRLAKEILKR